MSDSKIRVGIYGAAGYTGGELIRVLLGHPQAEIAFAHSESNAGNAVADIHTGLTGDTDLRFTDHPSDADVVFLCFGHGKSRQFLKENSIPADTRIIDLAQDFRIEDGTHDFVYGLPEINRERIRQARHIANPGCFATCAQLALLPIARSCRHVVINAVTGSTGAGQKPQATTHFSWRAGNMSVYKPFTHQHLPEIKQSLGDVDIDFIPWRGDFARGIFLTAVTEVPAANDAQAGGDLERIESLYSDFYAAARFTHYSPRPIDLKQVTGTNKCLVHADIHEGRLLVTAAIDNLLKGAVGQAVQNMNLMFNIHESTGLGLKAIAF